MKRVLAALSIVALALLSGCPKTKAKETTPATAPAGGTGYGGTGAGDSACVSDCVQAHQMVAESPEAIHADCVRSCAEK